MTDNFDGEWSATIDARLMPANFDTHGDEWIQHLRTALIKTAGSGASGLSWDSSGVRIRSIGGRLRSVLWFSLDEEPIGAHIIGHGTMTEDQVQPWIEAATEAYLRLGKALWEFEWNAIIGQQGHSLDEIGSVALGSPTAIGPLRIQPGGQQLIELVPAVVPSLRAPAVRHSWPVVVNGSCTAYSWNMGVGVAACDLHRLCVLLSVAFNTCWTVREAPTQGRQEAPDLSWFGKVDPRTESSYSKEGPRTTVDVPAWLSSAWGRLDVQPELPDALGAFHTGLALYEAHPSHALVALVGALETIGTWLSRQDRCDACANALGSGKRFRAALDLVMPPKRAAALQRLAYSLRSGTAHRGRLHGNERELGAPPGRRFFTPDPAHRFTWGPLQEVRDAARAAIIRVLAPDIEPPPARRFEVLLSQGIDVR